MKKTFIFVMFFTLIAKVFGFVREMSLSYFFGASVISDAYLISILIPNTLYTLVAAAISAAYIPIFSKVYRESGSRKAFIFSNTLLFSVLIISILLVINIYLSPKIFIKIFASGFSAEAISISINLLKITSFSLIGSSVIAIFTSFLHIKNTYIIPAIIGIPMNIIMVLTLYLSTKTSLEIAAYGFIVAISSQLILLIPFIIKKGYNLNLNLNFKDKYIRQALFIIGPIFIAVAGNELNGIIDKTIASRIMVGGVSIINYSFRLNGFVEGIIVTSMITIIFPLISKYAAVKKYKEVNRQLEKGISLILLFILPVSFFTMIFSEDIIRFLYGRGAFTDNDVAETSKALFFYSLGMIPYGLRALLTRGFYSIENSVIPAINSFLMLIFNTLLSISFYRFTNLGIGGIAFATSISSWIIFILYYIQLGKKIGFIQIRNIIPNLIIMSFSSLLLVLSSSIIFHLTKNVLSLELRFFLSSAGGGISYFLIIYLKNVENTRNMINSILMNIFKKK